MEKKIESYLKKNNYQFSFRTEETSSPLRKKGTTSVSLTFRRNSDNDSLILPLTLGEYLTDFEGKMFGSREIFFREG